VLGFVPPPGNLPGGETALTRSRSKSALQAGAERSEAQYRATSRSRTLSP
jgi:hypothetical protein